jgi:hypothetical protein
MLEKIITKENTNVDKNGRVHVVYLNSIVEDGMELTKFYTTEIVEPKDDFKKTVDKMLNDTDVVINKKTNITVVEP